MSDQNIHIYQNNYTPQRQPSAIGNVIALVCGLLLFGLAGWLVWTLAVGAVGLLAGALARVSGIGGALVAGASNALPTVVSASVTALPVLGEIAVTAGNFLLTVGACAVVARSVYSLAQNQLEEGRHQRAMERAQIMQPFLLVEQKRQVHALTEINNSRPAGLLADKSEANHVR